MSWPSTPSPESTSQVTPSCRATGRTQYRVIMIGVLGPAAWCVRVTLPRTPRAKMTGSYMPRSQRNSGQTSQHGSIAHPWSPGRMGRGFSMACFAIALANMPCRCFATEVRMTAPFYAQAGGVAPYTKAMIRRNDGTVSTVGISLSRWPHEVGSQPNLPRGRVR